LRLTYRQLTKSGRFRYSPGVGEPPHRGGVFICRRRPRPSKTEIEEHDMEFEK
jgi:hypothetical protein